MIICRNCTQIYNIDSEEIKYLSSCVRCEPEKPITINDFREQLGFERIEEEVR